LGNYYSFYIVIVGILLIGTASALGQATILGFGRFFSPKLVGGWSGGTGGAGIAGTLIYLLLKTVLKLSNLAIFCAFIPCTMIYFGCFLLLAKVYGPEELVDYATREAQLENAKTGMLTEYNADNNDSGNYGYNERTQGLLKPDTTQTHLNSLNSHYKGKNDVKGYDNQPYGNDLYHEFGSNVSAMSKSHQPNERNPLFDGIDVNDKFSNAYGSVNNNNHEDSFSKLVKEQSLIEQKEIERIQEKHAENILRENWCSQFTRVWPQIWVRATMLCAIYFLEYVIQSLYSNHATTKTGSYYRDEWAYRNAYEVLAFCYQIGVFFSRSSIGCFQFSMTWLLTLLQLINFIVWGFQAEFHFVQPYWLLFPAMIWVGVMAGLCYVNTFYFIQNDRKLGKDKEFAINIVSIGINIGITASSIFTLIADHTWFA